MTAIQAAAWPSDEPAAFPAVLAPVDSMFFLPNAGSTARLAGTRAINGQTINPPAGYSHMTAFVLVHGAWHGAWQWDKVVPLLESRGAQVHAVDLPGRGDHSEPLGSIRLSDYADAVSHVVIQQDEPVVLVGHSLGGLSCSMAAERFPDRVKRLIYVAGMLFAAGQTVRDMASFDPEALTRSSIDRNLEEGWSEVSPGKARAAFYADCSDADAEAAETRIGREPLGPASDPIEVTDANFGRVPRSYIGCRHDRAITYDYQRRMLKTLPCDPVITMDTGHSPFLSAPEELATHLWTM